jgi:hypothetical protein
MRTRQLYWILTGPSFVVYHIFLEVREGRRGGGALEEACDHKVLTYTEHHSVCPLVGIGTPPTPLTQASVLSPPDQRVGGGGTPACP